MKCNKYIWLWLRWVFELWLELGLCLQLQLGLHLWNCIHHWANVYFFRLTSVRWVTPTVHWATIHWSTHSPLADCPLGKCLLDICPLFNHRCSTHSPLVNCPLDNCLLDICPLVNSQSTGQLSTDQLTVHWTSVHRATVFHLEPGTQACSHWPVTQRLGYHRYMLDHIQ